MAPSLGVFRVDCAVSINRDNSLDALRLSDLLGSLEAMTQGVGSIILGS